MDDDSLAQTQWEKFFLHQMRTGKRPTGVVTGTGLQPRDLWLQFRDQIIPEFEKIHGQGKRPSPFYKWESLNITSNPAMPVDRR